MHDLFYYGLGLLFLGIELRIAIRTKLYKDSAFFITLYVIFLLVTLFYPYVYIAIQTIKYYFTLKTKEEKQHE
mgnify:CR=1 FL=1